MVAAKAWAKMQEAPPGGLFGEDPAADTGSAATSQVASEAAAATSQAPSAEEAAAAKSQKSSAEEVAAATGQVGYTQDPR